MVNVENLRGQNNLQADLREEFEQHAAWRRRKSQEYPADRRNEEAAARLDRLAFSVIDCPSEAIEAARGLFDFEDVATWQDMMRGVGFSDFPASAEEFCRDFIHRQTGG